MKFPEVLVLACFEEQLSLLSEDLSICMNPAFPAGTQLRRPTDVLNPQTLLLSRADALFPKTQPRSTGGLHESTNVGASKH